ncbi:hypothetical protein ACFPAF_00150 [Hymenobacter endophyticus]|uniref:Uncharacterized protein n=1 Tax=Hymenobacter endophyticus TaxID=3076335 RepID=A0ABU3TBN8_9BACT|nr:hypothetical protein [Hymenobacter endophyticus]MDU0368788.1 hypothetical protein [Hymenobacter endophyticus]
MLDFYLVSDSQNLSSKGLTLERIGGIEYEVFVELQVAGIIEPWLDYYGKFRWGNELVIRKQQQLHRLPAAAVSPGTRAAFAALLQFAVQAHCGLLAEGD